MSEENQYADSAARYWLRTEMIRYRVPQRQVAKAIGLDPSSFNRALRGTRRLSSAELRAALQFVNAYAAGMGSSLGLLMFQRGLDVAYLADKTGIEQERMHVLAERSGKPPTMEEARALSAVLGIPVAELTPIPSPPANESSTNNVDVGRDADRAGNETLPVFGALHHLGNGWFSSLAKIVEHRKRPAALIGVASAFAVYVGDPLLLPRYEPGEVLFLHEGRPLTVGRWGLVEGEDGRVAMGRVVAVTGDGMTLLAGPEAPEVHVLAKNAHRHAVVVGSWIE